MVAFSDSQKNKCFSTQFVATTLLIYDKTEKGVKIVSHKDEK